MKKDNTTEKKIAEFIANYDNRKCEEEAEYVDFWNDIFEILEIDDSSIKQKKVHCCFNGKKSTRKIDVYTPKTKVIIEQKSSDVSLDDKCRDIEDRAMDAFEQAEFYRSKLKPSEQGRYIVTCNFHKFRFYDLEQDLPAQNYQEIDLKDLSKNLSLFEIFIDPNLQRIRKEEAVSAAVGDRINDLYEGLKAAYGNNFNEKDINILCVRIIFCLFAEDAGLFTKDAFCNYFSQFPASCIQDKLLKFFDLLNTHIEDREGKYFDEEIVNMPYVNGGLFANASSNSIPAFTDKLKKLVFTDLASENWEDISPTIFGSVFESTLDAKTRGEGGMHYTSMCNIHKVIDPLFMENLEIEFEDILDDNRHRAPFEAAGALCDFQEKLAGLKFLDPACGSGNFLTETYLSLRRLENKVLKAMKDLKFGEAYKQGSLIKIQNFHGMEINDYAQLVAKTALWIADYQMFKETWNVCRGASDFLPLKTNDSIKHCNALKEDWSVYQDVDYIIGNPPFVGSSKQTKEQKQDMLDVFGKNWPKYGLLDYVTCWYKKSADLMKINSKIKTALVSTNSITQGIQVNALWTKLFEDYGIHIDFAYHGFKWQNDAKGEAQVVVIIVAFSIGEKDNCTLFEKTIGKSVKNINGYLMDYKNVAVVDRTKPLCKVNRMVYGNKPADGGALILSEAEYKEFIEKEPESKKWIKRLIGADELIKGKVRYCLWLKDATQADIDALPMVKERVELCRKARLKSTKKATIDDAATPHLFQETRVSNQNFLCVPRTTSDERSYIPIEYYDASFIPSDAVFTISATVYDFGVLESSIHMTWNRKTCGRLGDGYRYSNTLVYNNFPWPAPTAEQKSRIEKAAQKILDVRAKYSDKTLAWMYDEKTMPEDLRKAHRENDLAVIAAYGWSPRIKETDIVHNLFEMYEELVNNK
ncbi:MAG: N-6 DNA methylase [Paludibacteraceae bacterium]|nr:N-6 DNA methylase [Paludibacteraceae bacterium]